MWVKSVPPLAGILCISLLFFWAAAAAEDGEDEMDDMMEDYFEYYLRESTRSGNLYISYILHINCQCVFPPLFLNYGPSGDQEFLSSPLILSLSLLTFLLKCTIFV